MPAAHLVGRFEELCFERGRAEVLGQKPPTSDYNAIRDELVRRMGRLTELAFGVAAAPGGQGTAMNTNDAINQLTASIAANGTPDHVFLPYEDLCELRGVPIDPWLDEMRRLTVHVHAGEWHFLERCTADCPR